MAPEGQQNAKTFLTEISTVGLITAIFTIPAFLVLAYCLYKVGGEGSKKFAVKVGDFLLQGALISLFFGILNSIILGKKSVDLVKRKLGW